MHLRGYDSEKAENEKVRGFAFYGIVAVRIPLICSRLHRL